MHIIHNTAFIEFKQIIMTLQHGAYLKTFNDIDLKCVEGENETNKSNNCRNFLFLLPYYIVFTGCVCV